MTLLPLTRMWVSDPLHTRWIYGRTVWWAIVISLALIDLVIVALLVVALGWLAATGVRLAG